MYRNQAAVNSYHVLCTKSLFRCYTHPEPPARALLDNVSTFLAYISASLKCGVNRSFKFTVPFRTDVYIFLFGQKGKEHSYGLGRWYENEDFNTEYFPCNWYKCHDKLGDGCTIDFPICLHSKLKWSPTTFIKQVDGTVMPKEKSFEEVLVVNLVKKRC